MPGDVLITVGSGYDEKVSWLPAKTGIQILSLKIQVLSDCGHVCRIEGTCMLWKKLS
jgi:hypothetical protein